MRQNFSKSNKPAYQNLEVSTKKTDIHVVNQELPPFCEPKTAEVGFWIRDHHVTKVIIFEEISYSGHDPIVNNWLKTKEIKFSDFNSLKDWYGLSS